MKYRKKPVVIEAVQLTREMVEGHLFDGAPLLPSGVSIGSAGFHRVNRTIDFVRPIVDTLEGRMLAEIGDYIITGIKGEHYACKPDIFAATYEAVTE